MIEGLSDHFIICGYGRVGRQVARDLRAADARYVVIDPDPVDIAAAQDAVGVRAIRAQPPADDAPREAVIACVDSDAENIFIALTARELSAQVGIVARASREDSKSKLKRAGRRPRDLARQGLPGGDGAPRVAPAGDRVGRRRLRVPPRGDRGRRGVRGGRRALADVVGGSMFVGLRPDGTFAPQPPGDTILGAGDVIVAMGTPRTMDRLEKLFARERSA